VTALLELRDVSLTYNRRKADQVDALKGLDLRAREGEFVTIVGANGAGKSSLVQLISGAVRPTTGGVFLESRDITRWPDYRRARYIARVFDDPRIGSAPELSIEDNLALASSRGRRRTLRLALNRRNRVEFQDRLAALGLGLEHRLHDSVGLLSAGQRQSLTMVMAGLVRPRLLLLDEHLAALDPSTARKVLDLTVTLAKDMACTTLMVTHNMEHAIETGDRLLVMSRGTVIADFNGEDKKRLTIPKLVQQIASAGDTLSDRVVLAEHEDAGVSR
jgi:putative ABC transport system ATP-binding protein